ncbi:sugar transferase [Guptibacillus hwajinpoensis]|uniref:Sugar transferase EpsL n=1 Tax=Guptibacillus hwajinpoensis TaxID=208199 RepID=A0ABU0JZL1_9BACL|nr:sugar transferase [Alkalihalobacillus hemicentroti]MDQ0482526.1 sugar transferase EpsL [Alkalihalobacillus hemicentroti]
MKRVIDLVLSALFLLILSPIVVMTCVLIRFKLGSPIIFKQERIGYKEKLFIVYKLRTMSDARDEKGQLLPDSIRLTRLGKVIRKLSIDEIPQLVNVLKGDMSIVGPRPLLVKYLPYYTERERMRHQVKPGITGLAQITGRNILKWDERFAIDVEYVENQSIWLDMKIMILTVVKVVRKEDIVDVPGDHLQDFDIERQLKA